MNFTICHIQHTKYEKNAFHLNMMCSISCHPTDGPRLSGNFQRAGLPGGWYGTPDRPLQDEEGQSCPGKVGPGLWGPPPGALPPPWDLESIQEVGGSAHPGAGRGTKPGLGRRAGWGQGELRRGIILKLRAAIT